MHMLIASVHVLLHGEVGVHWDTQGGVHWDAIPMDNNRVLCLAADLRWDINVKFAK